MSTKHHDAQPGKLDYCQITGSKNLFEAMDLGHQPPCDALLSSEDLHQPEVSYPLRLMISPESGLGQLDHIVSGNIIYPVIYPYRAGISKPLKDYLLEIADGLVKDFKFAPNSLCVDIGCNDGTLLSGLKKNGMRTVGVEPTNMAQYAWGENGVETIQEFFTEDVAKQILEKYGKAKIITTTNVFAHMAPLGEVMRGINALLDKDGVFMTESQYLLDILERNQFDQVYHEHIRLYSLKSLVKLFPYYGMEVFDAESVSTREGSLRAYACWKGAKPVSKRVKDLLQKEEEAGLFKEETWAKWRERVKKNRDDFMDFLRQAKQQGKKVVADSCPGRGAVLINYYGLDEYLIPYISQLPGSEKVGKYMPGTHIPIVDNSIIMEDQPDYIVILAWHYGDYIMKNWRAKGLKSKFIMPLPEFHIIQ